MAKFGENIFEFEDTVKYEKAPVMRADGNFFITVRNDAVGMVKDSKCVRAFNIPSQQPSFFSCAAVFFNGYLYSGMDRYFLIRWSIEDTRLEKAEKVKFSEQIYTIIPLYEESPLVIFQSGSFAMIDAVNFSEVKPFHSAHKKANDIIHWADATLSAQNIEVFYLGIHKKTKLHTLYYFTVNRKDKSVSSLCTYNVTRTGTDFRSCCLNHEDVSFLVLSSDGILSCLNPKEPRDVYHSYLHRISQDTFLDICAIDRNCIAVVKGKEKSKKCVLEIYDIKGSILKARQEFKTYPLNFLQIAARDDSIFLNTTFKLIIVPFFLDSTFCSLLNVSESEGYEELSWSDNLAISKKIRQHSYTMDSDLQQIPVNEEPNKMDTNPSNKESKDLVELIIEKLSNEDSTDFILESDLAKVLKIIISDKDDSSEKDYSKNKNIILNNIFSASVTEKILKYLKSFSVEETLITLELLLSNLINSTNIFKKPSDLQIVNWIYLMISSHTEAFLCTKERAVKKLLRNLKAAVSAKMEEYKDFEDIENYFCLMNKKYVLPQQQTDENYHVETLDI